MHQLTNACKLLSLILVFLPILANAHTKDSTRKVTMSLGFALTDRIAINSNTKHQWGGGLLEYHFGKKQLLFGFIFQGISVLDGSNFSYQQVKRDSVSEKLTVAVNRRISIFSFGALYFPIKRRTILQPYLGMHIGVHTYRYEISFPDINYRTAPEFDYDWPRLNRFATTLSAGIQINLSKLAGKKSEISDASLKLGTQYFYVPNSMSILLNDGSLTQAPSHSIPINYVLMDKRTGTLVNHTLGSLHSKKAQYLSFNFCFTLTLNFSKQPKTANQPELESRAPVNPAYKRYQFHDHEFLR